MSAPLAFLLTKESAPPVNESRIDNFFGMVLGSNGFGHPPHLVAELPLGLIVRRLMSMPTRRHRWRSAMGFIRAGHRQESGDGQVPLVADLRDAVVRGIVVMAVLIDGHGAEDQNRSQDPAYSGGQVKPCEVRRGDESMGQLGLSALQFNGELSRPFQRSGQDPLLLWMHEAVAHWLPVALV